MLTVHHLQNSRSQRVLWMLEELGVDYVVERYERDPTTLLAPEALRRIHPLGKSPVIEDAGTVVAETGAIIEYLIDAYGGEGWRPAAGSAALLDYRYWLHYGEGSLMPLLVMSLVFSSIPQRPMPFFVRPVARALCTRVREQFIAPNLTLHLSMIERHLAGQEWFAGSALSGADIQMSFPLEAALSRLDGVADYPAITAYVARLQARDAYRRALARGGPYSILGGA